MPENLKFDRISAKFVNGVLEITIPVHEGALPKKIPIDVQAKPRTITAHDAIAQTGLRGRNELRRAVRRTPAMAAAIRIFYVA